MFRNLMRRSSSDDGPPSILGSCRSYWEVTGPRLDAELGEEDRQAQARAGARGSKWCEKVVSGSGARRIVVHDSCHSPVRWQTESDKTRQGPRTYSKSDFHLPSPDQRSLLSRGIILDTFMIQPSFPVPPQYTAYSTLDIRLLRWVYLFSLHGPPFRVVTALPVPVEVAVSSLLRRSALRMAAR